jgi:hypothetical protein
MFIVMGSVLSSEAAAMSSSVKNVMLMGDPASPKTAERTITINSDTKNINVAEGETIKFVIGEKTFAWHFDGPYSSFKLNQVAPEGTLDHIVTAYVSPKD